MVGAIKKVRRKEPSFWRLLKHQLKTFKFLKVDSDKGILQIEQLLGVWEQAGHHAMVPGLWTLIYSFLCLTVYSSVSSHFPSLVHSFPGGVT